MDKPLWIKVTDAVVDVAFLFDILLSFRTVVTYLERGEEVRIADPPVIIKNYLYGWFPIDAVSCGIPPWDSLIVLFEKPGLRYSSTETGFDKFVKLMKLIKLLRLLRIGRIFNRLFSVKPQAAKILRIVKMVTLLIATSHIFACFFWYISFESLAEYDGATWTSGSAAVSEMCMEEMQAGTCVVNQTDPSLNSFPHFDKDNWMRGYWEGFYWAVMTLTTVGYGDLSAGNVAEMIYSSVIMIIGAVIYAVILGSVTSAVTTLDAAKQPLLDKMERLQNFVASNGVGEILAERILETHQYVPSRAPHRQHAFHHLTPRRCCRAGTGA